VRKAKQCLYHLRLVRKFRVSFRDHLRWCDGEHPDRKNHCLVRQQLLSGKEGSAEGGVLNAQLHYTPHPAGPVLQEVLNQSLQDHKGSSPPQQPGTAVRQASVDNVNYDYANNVQNDVVE